MNLFESLKNRAVEVTAAVVAAVAFCCCGALMAFYLSPQQALQANRIAGLPQMDAGFVAEAEPGEDLLVTGVLAGNDSALPEQGFVAYTTEIWQVTPPAPDSESGEASGRWESSGVTLPALTIRVGGEDVAVLRSTGARLSGPLREVVVPGPGQETAHEGDRSLPEGSLRYRGFFEGDLITVLGVKASSGGIIPEELFAGDRVEFEESQVEAAKGLLFGGIAMMVCAPVVLVGGGLLAVFRKRRRRF